MQNEADWLMGQSDEPAQDAYKFFMRPDPDMREFLGPIEHEDDPLTGRVAKFRHAKVAMMRGADAEKEVKVYIGFDGVSYAPHIRLEDGKDLQGCYQG